MIIACTVIIIAFDSRAEGLRIATYNTGLSRDGPGLLLRDILRGTDAQLRAVQDEINALDPDILVLQDFDWDYAGQALMAFSNALNRPYSYQFALSPNSGLVTDLDLDGDGRRFGPRDAQGYGTYLGQGGMAILSRYPVVRTETRDFSQFLWRDLPQAQLPQKNGQPFPSNKAQAVQRLSSVGHWAVPIIVEGLGQITLLTWHGSPPVFDGPQDRNGRRGGDEVLFWLHFLDGHFSLPPSNFIIAGVANIDPEHGEGQKHSIARLLADARLQVPGGTQQPTAVWSQTGPMRVSYVLPAVGLRVLDSGVSAFNFEASRHGIVWVDLAADGP